MYLKFNNNYVLKPDNGKALVMAYLSGRNTRSTIGDIFTKVIHPIYAMILSFMDGRERDECIKDACTTLDVPKELIENFVDIVTDNTEEIYLKSDDGISAFPPFTLISLDEPSEAHRYEPSLFDFTEVNLNLDRHKTPSCITLMFNNICVTDCIYCYQDKTRKVSCCISKERVIELIHEAHKLHVNTFDVIGGEFFLYEHWREVLTELRKYGYNPYLSTKIPLGESDVKFLAELGVIDIQVSIDTFIEEHLIKSLKVKSGYAENMRKCLELLDSYGIPMMIHSVLTRFNGTKEDMLSVYEELRGLKNLKFWQIVKGDESLYPKAPYSEIEIDSSAKNMLVDYLNQLSEKGEVTMYILGKDVAGFEDKSLSEEQRFGEIKRFFNRTFCSGLFSSLYILPDGNVTICEQLYWNKDFIVGNVIHQSIEDVWNSDKSNSLFYIQQSDIPEDSLCHSCECFNQCRKNRQVCYREIIRKNGSDKWYYPDPGCPFLRFDDNNQR